MSVNKENINNHPINRAAKVHLDQMDGGDGKSAHIITLVRTLSFIHGLPYKRFEEDLIRTYLDKLTYSLDQSVMDFLLREVDKDYVEQFCDELKEIDNEIELRDYILDELIIPAIGHEYDGVFIKTADS